MLDAYQAGKLPRRLIFSFAALLAFYTKAEEKEGELFGQRGDQLYRLHESDRILALVKEYSGLSADGYVTAVLRESGLFDELQTLPQFAQLAAADLQSIRKQGAASAMAAVTESGNGQ